MDEAAPIMWDQAKAEPNHRTRNVTRTTTAPHSDGFRRMAGSGDRVLLLIVGTYLPEIPPCPDIGERRVRAHAPQISFRVPSGCAGEHMHDVATAMREVILAETTRSMTGILALR